MYILALVLTFFLSVNIASGVTRSEGCTDLARDEEPLLVLSTLRGGLVALDPSTGVVQWSFQDEPAVKVPTNTDQIVMPQFLPDPRDGSLYTWGTQGSNAQGALQKLPFTIPQLVANAPCRSSDGMLYSGRKSDTWYLVDTKTGEREQVLGFNSPSVSAPPVGSSSHRVFLGRTQYTVLMYSAIQGRAWNVTFVDYLAHSMPSEVSNEYEFLHLVGSGSGHAATLDRASGSLLWERDLGSPVVAAYLLTRDGLLAVPYTTVADETLKNIVQCAEEGFHKDVKLFQTLYVGEHSHGLYAIPSLVDKNTATIIRDQSEPLLLEGPTKNAKPTTQKPYIESHYAYYIPKTDYGYSMDDIQMKFNNYVLLGHYHVPKLSSSFLQIGRKIDLVAGLQTNAVVPVNSDLQIRESNHDNNINTIDIWKVENDYFNVENNNVIEIDTVKSSIGVQTDDSLSNVKDDNLKEKINEELLLEAGLLKRYVVRGRGWIQRQENKGLKFVLIVLVGLIIMMFWYLQHQAREFQQLSSSGSRSLLGERGVVTGLPEDLGDGLVKVGKIIFNTNDLLGKGCEGTFVFKGEFESRAVAVKRLLPECFTLAEREVSLLRESDDHPHVVRYHCTEQDRQFKYIALELCGATLQQYVEAPSTLTFPCDTPPGELLRQATEGLAHLHKLNIVHRDVKPHNVLLSFPSQGSPVRAMISDFGLCKKLVTGRVSFSRASGVAGTDGWIAPEMMGDERTTTAVDIFSLGCVFYYVLSKGSHPFGGPLHRQGNILSGRSTLTALTQSPLAASLVEAMIATDSHKRPSSEAVKSHPMFWSDSKVLSFLQDVSDRIERETDSSECLQALERGARIVVRGDWRSQLDPHITEDLRRYRSYQGDSVRDLLRALRNKKHHYHELSAIALETLGPLPGSFTRYWLERFPLLLLHTWTALQCLKHEPAFKGYYQSNFTFSTTIDDNERDKFNQIKPDDSKRNTGDNDNKEGSVLRIVYKAPRGSKWTTSPSFKNYDKNKNQLHDPNQRSQPHRGENIEYGLKNRNINGESRLSGDSDANVSVDNGGEFNVEKAPRQRYVQINKKKPSKKYDNSALVWTLPPTQDS